VYGNLNANRPMPMAMLSSQPLFRIGNTPFRFTLRKYVRGCELARSDGLAS
jgi:hypothetical protein